MIYLISILTLLQAADFYTTVVAIRSGKGKEDNPFAKKLMDAIGVIPALLLLKVGVATLAWVMYFNALLVDRNAYVAVSGLVVLYLVIVTHNFYVIWKK